MVDERRIKERFTLQLKARMAYSFHTPKAGESISTVTANISSGGAFLITDQHPPLASKVRLAFLLGIEELAKLKIVASHHTLRQLSGHRQVWVEATGVVIRQEGSGVAVIFDQNYQITPIPPCDGADLSG